MKKRIIFYLIKLLFVKDGFKKSLKRLDTETLISYKEEAIRTESYELASYLSFYLEFKRNKDRIEL